MEILALLTARVMILKKLTAAAQVTWSLSLATMRHGSRPFVTAVPG